LRLTHFRSPATRIFSGSKRSLDHYAISGYSGVLDHYYGVGALGNRGAGHDLDGLTRLKCKLGALAGSDLAGDFQIAWKVRCTDGEAVADRAIGGRIVAVRCYGFGQNAARGFEQIQFFGKGSGPVRTQL
jgi:hypothetical protein